MLKLLINNNNLNNFYHKKYCSKFQIYIYRKNSSIKYAAAYVKQHQQHQHCDNHNNNNNNGLLRKQQMLHQKGKPNIFGGKSTRNFYSSKSTAKNENDGTSSSGPSTSVKTTAAAVVDGNDEIEVDTDNNSLIEVEDEDLYLENEIYDSDGDCSLRKLLYSDAIIDGDPLMQRIIKCNDVDQIFKEIDENIDKYQSKHLVQSILILWSLMRHIRTSNTKQQPLMDVLKSKEFMKLFEKSGMLFKEMTIDEKCCCLLYFNKLGINMKHGLMQSMLDHAHKCITNEQADIPLTALSRFVVTVNAKRGLYTYYLCKDLFPLMLNHLNMIKTSEDLRLITICLNNLPLLITNDILMEYKEKVLQFIDMGIINADSKKSILRIISFLNYPRWSQRNTAVLRKLMLIVKDNIPTFVARELELLVTVYQSQLEPAEILQPIIEQSEKLLLKSPNNVDLMVCSLAYALPEKRLNRLEMTNEILNANESLDMPSLIALFKILRCLKVSHSKLCDKYWSKVADEIKDNPLEQEHYRIFRTAHRYMYFNNNLAGTYRNLEFERYITKYLVNELENGLTKWIPTKYAKLSSFVIAYGHTAKSRTSLPDFIIERLQAMTKQFTIFDCLHISRGLQIALELRYKNQISPHLAIQLHKIERILNECAERHLEMPNLTLVQLNGIIRSFNNRSASKRTRLFYSLLKKYETINYSELTSRLIRDITFNLNDSNHLIPSIFEHLLNYVLENRESLSGDIIEKILYCCYNSGYMPKDDDSYNDVFEIAVKIIQRDFIYMSGLSIVQACLALSFYQAVPTQLINRVFCTEFIKRIEDEIKLSYSKATYPQIVLNQVMQLNRAVCIDFPEAGVPWFQQNYIESQLSKVPVKKNRFHYDIKESLSKIISNPDLLAHDHITPYGYKIDFVLHLDKFKKLIKPIKNEEFLKNISKIAIVLLKSNSFPYNNKETLRGPLGLRQRHLEMLGYKVIQISYNDWNSMYMNIPGAKVNYLKNLLQIA